MNYLNDIVTDYKCPVCGKTFHIPHTVTRWTYKYTWKKYTKNVCTYGCVIQAERLKENKQIVFKYDGGRI